MATEKTPPEMPDEVVRIHRHVRGAFRVVGIGLGASVVWYTLGWPMPTLPTMSIPTGPDNFWEMVGAIAGVAGIVVSGVVGIVAYKGLAAIRLTQQDIKARVARETASCTIARLEEFAQELIPEHGQVVGAMAEHNVPPFLREKQTPHFNHPSDHPDVEAARAWRRQVPPAVINQCLRHLNRLEAWASYFLHGLADEKIAFEPTGPVLRAWVLTYYPFLVVARADPAMGNYVNLVALYRLWASTISAKETQQQVEEIERRWLEKKEELARAALPRPIGSDIK